MLRILKIANIFICFGFLLSSSYEFDTENCLSNEAMCSNQSVGQVNQLFELLIRTSLAYKCLISPSSMWPLDYGSTAVEQGKTIELEIEYNFCEKNSDHIFA